MTRHDLKALWLSGIAAALMSVSASGMAGVGQGLVTDRSDLKPIRLPCNSIKVLSEDGERYEPLPTIRCNRFVFIDKYPRDDEAAAQYAGAQQYAQRQAPASRIGNGRYDDDDDELEMAQLKWVPAPWSQQQVQHMH